MDNEMQESNVNEVPPQIAAQMKLLYQALVMCPDLLREGRKYGLRVGLSADAVAMIKRDHGDAANVVVANCLPIATS